MNDSAHFSFRGVAMLSLGVSLSIYGLHLYYFCYPLFLDLHLTARLADKLVEEISRTGLFGSLLTCKLIIILFLLLACLAHRGQAERRGSLRLVRTMMALGFLLYFGSFVIFARLGSPAVTSCWYGFVTSAGWLLLLNAGMRLKRLLLVSGTSSGDIFGKQKAGFPQEERPITAEFSLHFRGKYRLEGRERNSWINLVNPRRGVLVLGSPGSGKSRFIIEPLLAQCMEKGRALFVYDFKFDALSRLAWNLFQYYKERYRPETRFYCINFSDVSRSHRCNVLEPSTLRLVSDAIGASRTIFLSINRTWAQQEGKFFVESPINILAAIIWYLRNYQKGKYCTLPHAIELLQTRYDRLFSVLSTEPEIRTLIQPFVDAFKNKSMEMLDGQMASAKISLARLASPEVYYILTGNDLSLDLNCADKPKILCLGGDPTRREALSPVLSLYIDQVSRLCNTPDRLPFALICDEFATVRATNVLTLFATARSNNVIPILAVQDLSQLRTQYTREEADAVLNISGNFICGQTAGETAKWVSERFPKVLKDRSSVSTNSSDTSVSVTPQWEEAITPATLAMLSSGEFVGVTADDPGVEA
ncbi:MAG TPA: YWFCY domain-containing protein, partial [Puia sp.]|nr:YWFCY domain-containing protein [Puia sp.]